MHRTIAQDWLSALRKSGCRVTGARSAVVETVAAADHALTPLDVYQATRSRYPALGLVTVYRTLEKLEGLGLIQRVHQESGCQAFVSAGRGHQHLLVCQTCGHITYFEGDNLDPLIDDIANQTGYRIQAHWLQLFGTCRQCQQVN